MAGHRWGTEFYIADPNDVEHPVRIVKIEDKARNGIALVGFEGGVVINAKVMSSKDFAEALRKICNANDARMTLRAAIAVVRWIRDEPL